MRSWAVAAFSRWINGVFGHNATACICTHQTSLWKMPSGANHPQALGGTWASIIHCAILARWVATHSNLSFKYLTNTNLSDVIPLLTPMWCSTAVDRSEHAHSNSASALRMSAVSPKPSSKPLYLPNMQVRFAYKDFKDATAAAYLLVSVILQLLNLQYTVSM